MLGEVVDGQDVFAVHAAATTAIERAGRVQVAIRCVSSVSG